MTPLPAEGRDDGGTGPWPFDLRWQGHIRPGHFTWDCPKCGATNSGDLADEPVSGWDAPRWQLTGDRDAPTLRPSLGCWACYPEGHYWCNEGVLSNV